MDQIKEFQYSGKISASKSLYNRALILQSFFPDFHIIGESQCEDVLYLRQALMNLETGLETAFDCGSGGTTLRFLLARLSREEGEFVIRGSNRLMQRPHKPLYDSLRALGCEISYENAGEIHLISKGWQKQKVTLNLDFSSQFLSALLLSCWKLPFDFEIQTGPREQGGSYLEMTIAFLKSMGMVIDEGEDFLKVPKNQEPKENSYEVEPDMSSAFTLGAFAFLKGKLVLESFPEKSLQPDFIFTELFEVMGAKPEYNSAKRTLIVEKAQSPQSVNWNLRKNPDLFPVLAVLLSRVPGESFLSGLEALAFKESHRLDNIVDLLSELGFKCSVQNKRFVIKGEATHTYPEEPLNFDPDQDHRMAMAAALACYQGASIEISHPEVVNKSFPEFWEILKL